MWIFSSYSLIFGLRPDSFQDHISVDEHKHLIFLLWLWSEKYVLVIHFRIWVLALLFRELLNPHLNNICRSKKPTCPQLTFNKRINIILPYSFCPNNLSLVNILYKLSSEIECNPKCHLLAISNRHTLLKLFFACLVLLFEISTYGSDSQFTTVNSIKQSYTYLHSSSSPVKCWRVIFPSFCYYIVYI